MKTTVSVTQMLIRLCGVILLVLGILFWTGNAIALVPIHMLIGSVLVISLWVLAFTASRAGAPTGRVVLAFTWGLLVVIVGMTQGGLLPGPAHWVVQVIHLLLGIGAIGQAEGLAANIKHRGGVQTQAG
jgi:hypothetical protein